MPSTLLIFYCSDRMCAAWRRISEWQVQPAAAGSCICASGFACFFAVSARPAVLANPLRRSCVSKRSRCGAVRFVARETAFGSCLVVCAPAFAILRSRVRFLLEVRGSSGLKIAAFKYKRSTRSVLLQLRLENRNFQVR